MGTGGDTENDLEDRQQNGFRVYISISASRCAWPCFRLGSLNRKAPVQKTLNREVLAVRSKRPVPLVYVTVEIEV